MLSRFLEEVIWADPEITGVTTSISVANRLSWRCLEKLGFGRSAPCEVPGETGPQYVMSIVRPGATG